jgi:hypothetical protein
MSSAIELKNLKANEFNGSIAPFGRAEWIKYGDIDPGPEPEYPQDLYDFWNGPDPVDPTQSVYETHTSPIFRSNRISFGKLGFESAEWYRSIFEQFTKLVADFPSWVVMRKGVLATDQTPDERKEFIKILNCKSGAGYEEVPSVLDLATIIFAQRAYTGERLLKDASSSCRETAVFSNGKELYW